jgi:Domain of unknown function (DUF6766)
LASPTTERRWEGRHAAFCAIFFLVIFVAALIGQAIAGHSLYNQEQLAHGEGTVSLWRYVTSSSFGPEPGLLAVRLDVLRPAVGVHKAHGGCLLLGVPLLRLLGGDRIDDAMRAARLEDGLAALRAGDRR